MPTKKIASKKKKAQSASTSKAAKKSSTKKGRAARVRMYKQGLGDCFLVTLPRKPQPFQMLIDCGALKSKHYGDPEMNAAVSDIQQTVLAEAKGKSKKTAARLDVVAATHEHWDHISGFHQAKEIFDTLDVKKVWVAWTEQPDNEAAKKLKKEFKKKKKAVKQALALLPEDERGDKRLGLYRHAISELFGFFGGLGVKDGPKEGGTEATWDYMLALGSNEYCDPKKKPLKIEGLDDVRVYILGPPEDPDYIRKKLSKTETYDEGKHSFSLFDSFMAAVATDDDDDFADVRTRARPFDDRHSISTEQAKSSEFFKSKYGFEDGDADEWRRIDYEWLNMAGELALHLDSYTNNTCLALAIELGEPGKGKVMLFPGDAQVGNWLSWGDLSWEVEDSKGKKQTVTAADLLARTVLYKVGHHGSHNATLRKKGLEMMLSPDLVAMIPVHRGTADDQQWEFPYPPLWEALKLRAKGRVLLADAPDLTEIEPDVERMLSPTERKEFKKACSFEDLYVEYRIAY